ncbi:MAG: alanine racemase [Limnochordia bacterium]|jgi:alanine racemase|nr:alanine racemase [Bacillota bacterium]HOB09329.1 alanine racemase [Limnochordia bacterium]NLH30604.1 alanine racemase [Bacillota bacterium]HPT93407.1 alanine racemase [Limnochordia bacterium]HPZ30143.1 alanine racemase [Limnochordia bacterium]
MEKPSRPVWAEISLGNAAHNAGEFKRLIGPDCQLMAVIKANGYGHGDLPMAQAVLASGASWLAVALPEEGAKLRRAGIAAPILVLGAVSPPQLELCAAKDLVVTVFQWDIAQALSNLSRRLNKTVKVHVKVDTGMTRLGLMPEETVEFVKRLRGLPGIEVQGIYTHFACADQPHDSYTQWQWQRFSWVLMELEKEKIHIPLKHCANTAAAVLMPETRLDLVRVGIGLYGLHPCSHTKAIMNDLRPVMSLHTQVMAVKQVAKGTGVSYGRAFVTWKDTAIAVLPIGYADGLLRRLGERGEVLINGRRYPFAGRITMDHCMVDVGGGVVEIGDVVTLIGRQGEETITADDWAEWIGTINYEIPCMISERVERIYCR